jgi:hypothetical protein
MSAGGPEWEWTPVLDPSNEYDEQLVGLSGWALGPKLSDQDLPFLHPFGFDFEFMIAPDPPYQGLIAPLIAPHDQTYLSAVDEAQTLGIDTGGGLLGLEVDQGLVPGEYRPQNGDRVAVWGRWIVDDGHDDFRTEIHPPLLIAAARPFADTHCLGGAPTTTHLTLVTRPYLVSQKFGEGGLSKHLFMELLKVMGQDQDSWWHPGIPGSTQIEVHPGILPVPFSGIHAMTFVVRPPSLRSSPDDKLRVSFHFTVRQGCAIQLFAAGQDAVAGIVLLNDTGYIPAHIPPKHDWTINFGDLWNLNRGVASAWATMLTQLGLQPSPTPGLAQAFLARGILTDRYDPPVAASPVDSENVVTNASIDALRPGMGISQDDNQPFPIYGWLNLGWESHFCLGASLAGVSFPASGQMQAMAGP